MDDSEAHSESVSRRDSDDGRDEIDDTMEITATQRDDSIRDVSYHPGRVVFYSPPKQRQTWGDSQILPRYVDEYNIVNFPFMVQLVCIFGILQHRGTNPGTGLTKSLCKLRQGELGRHLLRFVLCRRCVQRCEYRCGVADRPWCSLLCDLLLHLHDNVA